MTCYDFSHDFHYKSKTPQVKNLTCDDILQRAFNRILSKSENSHALDLASTTAGRARLLLSNRFHHNQVCCYLYVSLALLNLADFCLPKLPVVLNSQRALSCQVPPNPPHLVFVHVSVCYFSRATTCKPYLGQSIEIWGDRS